MLNRTIKDAIAAEEAFFRSHPAYDKIAGRCGVPQLATEVNLILVHHLNIVLQGFKSFFSSTPGSLAKELAGIAI
ncbi:dynamin-related protein 3A-like [Bidens hawaiensis]|uniref:dynamin-related protein 3A-like n=1 Tax=Bidens hawaiensis TaxID=980011 RepID=UPI00404A654C